MVDSLTINPSAGSITKVATILEIICTSEIWKGTLSVTLSIKLWKGVNRDIPVNITVPRTVKSAVTILNRSRYHFLKTYLIIKENVD